VLQLTGYRDPNALRFALEYVQRKRYLSEAFSDYLSAQKKPVVYSLRPHPKFERATYFKGYDQPLAILFEDRYCMECDRFHEHTLNHPSVMNAMDNFLVVRLDTESEQPLIALDGTTTTAARWLESMGMTYRPALVLFNEGKEMYRADGRLYHQHLTEALRFVGGGFRHYADLDEFKSAYREELMKNGIDVDFSE
jgi:thioredoxin-related protein